MRNVVRLATVDPNEESRTSLKNLLIGIDAVWLEAECSRYEFFLDVVQQTQPDLALVNIDSAPEKALDLIREIRQEAPGCSVLVVSSSQEGSLILKAMRNGASEFLNMPLNLDDFIAALNRMRSSNGGADGDGDSQNGKVITICGVSGGVGTTALAVNVASELAQRPGFTPVLVDLDLTLGDADVWLDIIPDYTILDVAENISRLDYSLLKRSLTRHDSGAYLLPRPVELDRDTPITPEDLRRIIGLLKATVSHLVIDVSKSFAPLDIAAMEMSSKVLMVTQLDLSCLRNVVRIMKFLDEFEGLSDKIEIVVNRIGLEDSDISLNKALETIGRRVFWQLPNDYATMVGSRNNGLPLCLHSPKARLTRSISDMVNALGDSESHGDAEETTVKKKGGLFGLFAK